jgi:hypothetical protein
VSDGSLNGGNAGDLDGDGRDDFLLQCGNVWNDCPSDVFPLP